MGAPLDDFTITTDKLTGAAWDSESNTLLVLTFDYSHLDLVKEYTTDGELVDTPLAVDAVTGNGQGLHYNSQTGVLHVTSQFGTVAIWEREVIPEPLLLGDANLDGEVNGLDVDPFVEVLLSGPYQAEADMNEDQVVNGLDVDPFVAAVVGGGGTQQIPEPSALLLYIVALGAVSGWRKWGG